MRAAARATACCRCMHAPAAAWPGPYRAACAGAARTHRGPEGVGVGRGVRVRAAPAALQQLQVDHAVLRSMYPIDAPPTSSLTNQTACAPSSKPELAGSPRLQCGRSGAGRHDLQHLDRPCAVFALDVRPQPPGHGRHLPHLHPHAARGQFHHHLPHPTDRHPEPALDVQAAHVWAVWQGCGSRGDVRACRGSTCSGSGKKTSTWLWLCVHL